MRPRRGSGGGCPRRTFVAGMLALPPSKDQSQGSSAASGSVAPGADAANPLNSANSVSDEWLPELPQEKEWDGFDQLV